MMEAAVLVTLIVIVGTTLLLYRLYRQVKDKNSMIDVVFCGPAYAGKTSLLLQLVRGSYAEAQTSQCVNKATLQQGNRKVAVVDTPGNFRLLSDSMKYVERARALVFVVDSSDKQSFKIAAQQLVDILLSAKVIANSPRVLLFANKADVIGSRSIDLVMHFIELEAERILKAYKSESHLTKISQEAMDILNQMAQDNFSLENISLPFKWYSGSVKKGDLAQVRSFIEDS